MEMQNLHYNHLQILKQASKNKMKNLMLILFIIFSIPFISFAAKDNKSEQMPDTKKITKIPDLAPANDESENKTAKEDNSNLEINFIDLNEIGDAIFIKLPNDKKILIDSGANDKKGELILNFLSQKKVEKIDIVLLSHPHIDHMGGLPFLLKNIKIDKYIDSRYPSTTKIYKNILEIVNEKNIAYETVKKGDTIDMDKNVSIEVLSPLGYSANQKENKNVNNSSVVLKIVYNNISFLLTGDAEKEIEYKLIESSPEKLKSTVLKAAHHGGKNSTTSEFLEKVQPEYIVISTLPGSEFHPHQNTLKRIVKTKSKIYRTDLNGTIKMTTDGNDLKINTER